MSVWVVCPSARPVEEVQRWAPAWRERGYKIAIWIDEAAYNADLHGTEHCDFYGHSEIYPGYAVSVNQLVESVLLYDPQAEWFIAAGDDIFPDPNKSAEEIARECCEHFAGYALNSAAHLQDWATHATFGVMQPTGDPWSDRQGRIIDRIAGSAWYGREYCRRINQGRGPLWPNFRHMFVDQCARDVAMKLGVYWERPDLCQMHMHWGRPKPGEKFGDIANMPEFLRSVNTPEHWNEAKAEYERLKADGFKECMPV